jgi:ABC-type branched-subunit amino acid transport system ATPase component
MLKVINAMKYFGGVHAVDDVSFSIEEGKITALIGPNGSGKSTLFNLISGVYELDSGKIVFLDKQLNKLSIDERSNLGISRIFQSSRMFKNLTLKENLILSLSNKDKSFWINFLGLNKTKKEDELIIIEALKLVGLESKINSIGSELSFGQKRLVEITRAILKPHKLLMLDEPVAGVTPALRDKIADLLVSLKKKGETILLIEHDMNFTLGIADEVIVLDEGKIIAKGTPKEIKKNKKVLEAYLGD